MESDRETNALEEMDSEPQLLEQLLGAAPTSPNNGPLRIDGVRVGQIQALDHNGRAQVVFPGRAEATTARSSTAIEPCSIGREVALLFEDGDPDRPLIMGYMDPAQSIVDDTVLPAEAEVEVDGKVVAIEAAEELVLRCGKASITLTRAGKVLIRGTYLSSRSSGANRIKGGSVKIN